MWEYAPEYHFCPDEMIIGGRSAGGNLSVALCLMAKNKGKFQFKCQILDHPWLDLCGMIDNKIRYDGKDSIGMENLDALATAYATDEQRREIYVSPLAAAAEELKELPPAVIQTCEYDCLRPDGDEYARKLRAAGVPVIHQCYMGATHGFTQDVTEDAQKGRRWLLDSIRKLDIVVS